MRKFIPILLLLCHSIALFAQKAAHKVEMADGLRQSGKIYVIVIGIVVIFLGIVAFLVLLERRVKKMEDEVNAN